MPTFAPVAGLAEKLQKNAEREPSEHTWQPKNPSFPAWRADATALFDLASETNAIDAVKADLDRFDAMVADSADLTRLVRSPVFSADEQVARADRGARSRRHRRPGGEFSQARDRQPPPVRGARHDPGFRELVAAQGRADGRGHRRRTLKDEHVAALRDALKAVSGKDVDLDITIDPAIIGGLVVKLGSRMVDTSLRTKLNAIKHAMKEAR